MTLDSPTLSALGYGCCVTYGDARDGCTLTPWPDLLGGKVRRSDDELREARRLRKQRTRARLDPAAVRAANLRAKRKQRAAMKAAGVPVR